MIILDTACPIPRADVCREIRQIPPTCRSVCRRAMTRSTASSALRSEAPLVTKPVQPARDGRWVKVIRGVLSAKRADREEGSRRRRPWQPSPASTAHVAEFDGRTARHTPRSSSPILKAFWPGDVVFSRDQLRAEEYAASLNVSERDDRQSTSAISGQAPRAGCGKPSKKFMEWDFRSGRCTVGPLISSPARLTATEDAGEAERAAIARQDRVCGDATVLVMRGRPVLLRLYEKQ